MTGTSSAPDTARRISWMRNRFVRGLRYSSKQHVFSLFIVNFIEIYRSFLYRIRP